VFLGKKMVENRFFGFETLLTQLSSDIWLLKFGQNKQRVACCFVSQRIQRQMISHLPHKERKKIIK
jgi:hypothetical protein